MKRHERNSAGSKAGAGPSFRKTLRKPGHLKEVRVCLEKISNGVSGRKFLLVDHLMSGSAIFSLKVFPLLQFDRDAHGEGTIRGNLRSLFGVHEAPSNSGLRKRLDEVDPPKLRPAFNQVFRALQRDGALEDYADWEGHHLLSIDGKSTFSSCKVHCANCRENHRRDGSVEYYQQMLAAAVVHPERREVFPPAPEPIRNSDGSAKNDCERPA